MIERFFILFVHAWLMISVNEATIFDVTTKPNTNYGFFDKRNVFINIVKRPDSEPFVASNRLDESSFWRIFHNIFRMMVRR